MLDVKIESWRNFCRTHGTAWDRMHNETHAAPDLSRPWAMCLKNSRNIHDDDTYVAFFRSESRLELVFPYSIESSGVLGFSAGLIRPLQSQHCLHNDVLSFLSPVDVIEPLIIALDRKHQWHVIQIDNLVDDAPIAGAWKKAAANLKLRQDISDGETPPYLRIDSTWDEFLQTKSKNFRYNLRRKRRILEKQGKVDVSLYSNRQCFSDVFEELIKIEQKSWKQAAGSAITSRQWERQFYRTVLPELLDAGQVQITVLRLDGKAIAHDISAVRDETAYSLKTSYDRDYEKLAPGIVLRTALLERLFEDGITEYDFLGSGERYKKEWGNGSRKEIHISIINGNWLGRVIWLRRRMRQLLG